MNKNKTIFYQKNEGMERKKITFVIIHFLKNVIHEKGHIYLIFDGFGKRSEDL